MSLAVKTAKANLWRRLDPAVATAFACIVVLLFVGSLYSRNFLSPEYLLQQLKVASFLGVIASGMMLAILLGQIDLSLPWVVTVGAIFGALIFRTIGDLLFVFDFDPLWQPLFQGVVLLLAVSLSAFGLLRVRNRLDWFG